MSLNKRRILYSLFILTFLIVTPLISLYATGYKITSGLRVQKTGIFIVDSEPRGANIYINGKIEQNIIKKYLNQKNSVVTTPAKIKNLLPGDYNIKIERDGYWPWEKKLEIKSGESTYAEDIFLFKNELPLKLLDASGEIFTSSRDTKSLVASQKNNLLYYHEPNQQNKVYNFSATSTLRLATTSAPLWSANSDLLLIDTLIFDINDWASVRDLRAELGSGLENIKWNISQNEGIFYQRNNALYRYDLNQKLVTPILADTEVEDYYIDDNFIILIKQNNNTSELITRRNDDIVSTITLPRSSYSFINPRHNLINLFDTEHEILYLIEPTNTIRPIHDSISNVNKTYWITNDQLLYANDFEIWLLDLNSSNRTLLTRISKPIKNIFWHPSNSFVIYSTENSLVTLELDQREKYNITKLIELDEIKKPFLSENGNAIYFYARIGRQEGIYKLNIQ